MDYQRRIDDRLLRRIKPTGFGDPRAGAAGEAGLGGMAGAANYLYLPWYDVAWQYRTLITIPRGTTTADLTNYKLYVSGTGMPANLWTASQATGNDLLLTLEDGVTKVAHDLPHFVPGSTAMELHTNISTLYALHDERRWLYYGNATCADQRDAAGVWAADHLGVWHLGEASGNYADSTGNGWTGTDNVDPGGKAGKLFATGGETFDGGDYALLPTGANAALNGLGAITISCWFKRVGTGTQQTVIAFGNATPAYKAYVEFRATDVLRVGARPDNGGTVRVWDSTPTYTDTTSWHHLAGVIDIANDSIALYVDGALVAGAGTTTWTPTSFDASAAANAGIAARYDGAAALYSGLLDELRVLEAATTATRVAVEYANQNSPSTFYTVGPATTRIVPALLTDTAGNGIDQGWML